MKVLKIPESGSDTKILEEGKSYMLSFLSDDAEERKVEARDGNEFLRYVFPCIIDGETTKIGLSAFTVTQMKQFLTKAHKDVEKDWTSAKWMVSTNGSGRSKRMNVNLIP
jgi:hypothetical protein